MLDTYDGVFYFSSCLFLMAGSVISLPALKYHKPQNSSNYVVQRSTSSIETQTFTEYLEDWSVIQISYNNDPIVRKKDKLF